MSENVGSLGYIPDFNFLGEAIVSCDVGIRLVDGGNEDVVSIWRGSERFVVSRLSNRGDCPGGNIDQGKLRSCEVIEDILVMRVAKGVAVFVGAALSFLAFGFLNARANRGDWLGRRRAHALGH